MTAAPAPHPCSTCGAAHAPFGFRRPGYPDDPITWFCRRCKSAIERKFATLLPLHLGGER